jgi:hypothetical protein
MNESKISYRRNNPVSSLVSIALSIAIAVSGLTGCKNHIESTARLTANDVIGLTEAELRIKYPESPERSISVAVNHS